MSGNRRKGARTLEDEESEITTLVERLALPAEDAFEYRTLADAVAATLHQCRPPFTLAICAPWGGGKSTFLQYVRTSLLSRDDYCLIIPFNAWHASIHEDVVGAFVAELVLSLDHLTHGAIKGYAARLIPEPIGRTARVMLKACGALFPLIEIGREALTEIAGSFDRRITTRLGKEEAFRRSFRDLCEQLNTYSLKPFVFVDELDRCTPSTLVRVIESIRLFFGEEGPEDRINETGRDWRNPFRFVVSVDESFVVRAFMNQYHLSHREASSYLSKFIQHSYHFPPKRWDEYVGQMIRHSPAQDEWFPPGSAECLTQILMSTGVETIREVRRMLAFLIVWQSRYYRPQSPVCLPRLSAIADSQARQVYAILNGYLFLFAAIKVLFPEHVEWAIRTQLLSRTVRGDFKEPADRGESIAELPEIVALCRESARIISELQKNVAVDSRIVQECVDGMLRA